MSDKKGVIIGVDPHTMSPTMEVVDRAGFAVVAIRLQQCLANGARCRSGVGLACLQVVCT